MSQQLMNDSEPAEEVIDLLADDPEPETLDLTEPKEEKEEKGEEEEESLEDEIEKELKPPSEEELELIAPVRRREILAKYPNLFKDFPYLEKAYYREQQFTEIFPTLPDAREASEKAKVMDGFEAHIMQGGNIGIVLDAIKQENPETFNQVIDNFFPTLHKVDTGAYHHLIGTVVKSTILNMLQEAKQLGEENGSPLNAAAQILNQFVFGTSKFQPLSRLSKQTKEADPKENELKTREQELLRERFETARDGLQDKVDNTIRATIEQNIDPKKSMSDYVRRNAIRDAFDDLEDTISKDTRFRAVLDKLWERAADNKFNKASLEQIRSAYLSKVRTLLPTVIKKARQNALKGSGKSHQEETPHRNPITAGRSTTRTSGDNKKPSDIPAGMKTIDFLMQD
jgi:hypothetical protein